MDVMDTTSSPRTTDSSVRTSGKLLALNRALRTYQWVMNVLLFVPMLMAHRIGEADLWTQFALGCVAFNFGCL